MIRARDHVLFQGDSITNAFRKPEEVCNAYQLGAGYAMLIAAELLYQRLGDGLRFTNRGVSGEGVLGLAKRWGPDCLELRPDVLSVLVGVNDSGATREQPNTSLADYERVYRELLAKTRAALPAVRLVLCEPFLLLVGAVKPRAIADVAERAAIVRRLAAEHEAVLVPLGQVFAEAQRRAPAEYWSFDGIHPNAQGHWLIAQAWLRAVAAR